MSLIQEPIENKQQSIDRRQWRRQHVSHPDQCARGNRASDSALW